MPRGIYKHIPHSGTFKKGVSLSTEFKEKISKSHLGLKHTQETKDKIGIKSKGRKHSEEDLIKMSKSMKGKNMWTKGIKNGNWKGGITPIGKLIRSSLEYKLWRKSCLERDNFTCQKTGQIGGNLETHHINNFADFPELRLVIENGITLSKEAHKLFHIKYSKKNNTLEQLIEFLNTK